ncbi:ArsR family transcriptional regulator [Streptomyces sp. NPDC047079]|uniref:ArsR family transcriptional regulator n=1 Tax=Streptomyces sp. NPDC047079 TaxID=3154607 RepID=UPI0033F295AC
MSFPLAAAVAQCSGMSGPRRLKNSALEADAEAAPVGLPGEFRRADALSPLWDAELAAGEIAERFEVTFGAVPQHLEVLRESGLVTLAKRQEALLPRRP